MADHLNERLKALKASMKEALGKLTGNDALAAEGARERSGGVVRKRAARKRTARVAKKASARGAKAAAPRRRS